MDKNISTIAVVEVFKTNSIEVRTLGKCVKGLENVYNQVVVIKARSGGRGARGITGAVDVIFESYAVGICP